MKIEIEVSEKNECTESPWWIIIDPHQNFKVDEDSIHDIASMITGPFFSREEAQAHLMGRSYAFSKNARVYCHSGYYSYKYREAYRKAEKESKK